MGSVDELGVNKAIAQYVEVDSPKSLGTDAYIPRTGF